MAVIVEVHNTGDQELRGDMVARLEHVFLDRPGEWRVEILGSQGSERWDLKITGPNAFERSYTLEESLGQHEPVAVAGIVARMLPSKG